MASDQTGDDDLKAEAEGDAAEAARFQERLGQAELAGLSGPTLFSNRFVVQSYPDGNYRLVFLEQYSPNQEQFAVFRTAVFIHKETAIQMAHQILEIANSTSANKS